MNEKVATIGFSSMPYPGLRPFSRGEADIFFGRDEQIDELLEKLHQRRFLAIVGSSGSGKSSLVRAGLISALEAGIMTSAGSSWSAITMRPGNSPIRNLASALVHSEVVGETWKNYPDAIESMTALLRRGPNGIVEVVGESNHSADANLLLVIDQFEELFRFHEHGNQNESFAFVELLLSAAIQSRRPIYIVLTMRSDFLGDCSLFAGLPEAINDGQFLVPRLTREQCREAIVGPAAGFGGQVDEILVTQMLNDMQGETDQLPLLQHALMVLWMMAEQRKAREKDDSAIHLTLADYEKLGGIEKSLSRHIESVIKKFSEQDLRITRSIFCSLTERSTSRRDIRRPTPINDLAKAAQVPEADVMRIAQHFRKQRRNFLMPSMEVDLNSNSLLDISHESLIRKWDRLQDWIEEEVNNANIYRRLSETAELWRCGRAALWGSPDLENAINWRDNSRPNQHWANRYGGDFELAMEFLTSSEDAANVREQQEEAARRRELLLTKKLAGRLRSLLLAACIFALLAISAAFTFWTLRQQALNSYQTAEAMRIRAEESAEESKRQEELARKAQEQADASAEEAKLAAEIAMEAQADAEESKQRLQMALEALEAEKMAAENAQRVAQLAQEKSKADEDQAENAKRLAVNQKRESIKNTENILKGVVDLTETIDDRVRAIGDEELLSSLLIKINDIANVVSESSDFSRKEFNGISDQLIALSTLTGQANVENLESRLLVLRQAYQSQNSGEVTEFSLERYLQVLNLLSSQYVRLGVYEKAEPIARELVNVLKTEPNRVKEHGQALNRLASIYFDMGILDRAESTYFGAYQVWSSQHFDRVVSMGSFTPPPGETQQSKQPPGGLIASASNDTTAKIWDANGNLLHNLDGHVALVDTVEISPDGQLVATGSYDQSVIIWNGSKQVDARTFEFQITDLTFSPDGKRLAIAGLAAVWIWNLETNELTEFGRVAETKNNDEQYLLTVDFSPNGQWVAAAGKDNVVTVWSTEQQARQQQTTGDPSITLSGHTARVLSLSFVDNNTLVTSSSDKTLKIWDIQNRKVVSTLSGNSGPIADAVVSGDLIISVDTEGTAKLWSIATGKQLIELKSMNGTPLYSVATLPLQEVDNGMRVLAGTREGEILAWAITVGPNNSLSASKTSTIFSKTSDASSDYVATLQGLAITFAKSQKKNEAIHFFSKVDAILTRKFGFDHPDTLAAKRNLVNALVSAKQYREALPVSESLYQNARKVFGNENPSTVAAMELLAEVFLNLEQFDNAISGFQKVLEANQTLFGDEWSIFEKTKVQKLLAEAYYRKDDTDQATAILSELLDSGLNASREQISDIKHYSAYIALILSGMGKTYEQLGLSDRVMHLFTYLDEIRDNDRMTDPEVKLLNEFCNSTGRYEFGIELLEKQKSKPGFAYSADFYNWLRHFYWSTGNPTASFEQAETMLVNDTLQGYVALYLTAPWSKWRTEFEQLESKDAYPNMVSSKLFWQSEIIEDSNERLRLLEEASSVPNITADLRQAIDERIVAAKVMTDAWETVRSPEFGSPTVTLPDIEPIRQYSAKHRVIGFHSTLAALEYQLGNYDRAISAAMKSRETWESANERLPEDKAFSVTRVVDVAIQAMSYFQLAMQDKHRQDNLQQAKNLQAWLEQEIKREEFSSDPDAKLFQRRMNSLFETSNQSEKK